MSFRSSPEHGQQVPDTSQGVLEDLASDCLSLTFRKYRQLLLYSTGVSRKCQQQQRDRELWQLRMRVMQRDGMAETGVLLACQWHERCHVASVQAGPASLAGPDHRSLA
jgi:hypothetical protein